MAEEGERETLESVMGFSGFGKTAVRLAREAF